MIIKQTGGSQKVKIQHLKRGQIGTAQVGSAEFTVMGTREGVVFLEDGDLMLSGGARLQSSTLVVTLYPSGTELAVTV
jgi:hypothetical protein